MLTKPSNGARIVLSAGPLSACASCARAASSEEAVWPASVVLAARTLCSRTRPLISRGLDQRVHSDTGAGAPKLWTAQATLGYFFCRAPFSMLDIGAVSIKRARLAGDGAVESDVRRHCGDPGRVIREILDGDSRIPAGAIVTGPQSASEAPYPLGAARSKTPKSLFSRLRVGCTLLT